MPLEGEYCRIANAGLSWAKLRLLFRIMTWINSSFNRRYSKSVLLLLLLLLFMNSCQDRALRKNK